MNPNPATSQMNQTTRRRRQRKEIFSCAIDPDTLELLYEISERREITLSQIGREALNLWLRSEKLLPDQSALELQIKHPLREADGSKSHRSQSGSRTQEESRRATATVAAASSAANSGELEYVSSDIDAE